LKEDFVRCLGLVLATEMSLIRDGFDQMLKTIVFLKIDAH
jgi:hypothetical protein